MENIYQVPKRQWKKWPALAQEIFNDLYQHMRDNQKLYLHPEDVETTKNNWNTTAWNAAFMAATFIEWQEKEKK